MLPQVGNSKGIQLEVHLQKATLLLGDKLWRSEESVPGSHRRQLKSELTSLLLSLQEVTI